MTHHPLPRLETAETQEDYGNESGSTHKAVKVTLKHAKMQSKMY